MDDDIVTLAKKLRGEIVQKEKDARMLLECPVLGDDETRRFREGEVKAHIMLAVRHLEDARMRLGKVCQWADDGVSIFDKGGE